MWNQVILIGGFLSLLGLVVLLASKGGSKSAQLEALKAELKKQAEERAYAEKIKNSVSNLSDNDVRKRLREIASDKR